MGLKIEDQVVSPETAKKLQELKVPQESYFLWVIDNTYGNNNIYLENKIPYFKWTREDNFHVHISAWCIPDFEFYSAFSVAELGMFFPISFDSVFTSMAAIAEDDWICVEISCTPNHEIIKTFHGRTEAESRANMIINLIESGIVKVEDLKL